MSLTIVETWTINDLIDSFQDQPVQKKKTIIPRYQRNLVWGNEKKKNLIDSIKEGLPVGAILLYNQGPENGNNIYQLIDGLQRSTSIRSYIEMPTRYLSEDNLPPVLIERVYNFLISKHTNLAESDISKKIISWIRERQGFKETDHYSSSRLARFLANAFEVELDMRALDEFEDILIPFLDEIRISSDISKTNLPVIIYSGPKSKLPLIFQRLNTQGVQLTKYQVFAATWQAFPSIPIADVEIIDKIKLKYDALIDEGLLIDNYDPATLTSSELNYFEIFFGLGKKLGKKHPELFGSSTKDDETDALGFVLGSLCLSHDLKDMGELPDKLIRITDFDAFLAKIEDAVGIVSTILRPYIALRANKRNGSEFPVPHSDFQIYSIIAKVFTSKYTEDLTEDSLWRNKKDLLTANIPFYYLYDILRGHWSGTGDSKALKYSKRDSDRYLNSIPKDTWTLILNEVFSNEMERREIKRTNISSEIVLFFKFIYCHLMTAHQDLSPKEFEIEHLVPLSILKEIALKDTVRGLPISAFPNLCLIDKSLNRDKGNQTIYEYYEQEVLAGRLTQPQADKSLKLLEELTFTTKDDLAFVKNLTESNLNDYMEFLNNRSKTIISKFLDLNNM
jgi:hypothetical protein